MSGQQIASAAAWGATKVHTLPSGRTVSMVAEAPNLFGVAARYGFSDKALDALTTGNLPMGVLVEIAPAVCRAMLVNPRVDIRDDDGGVPEGCLAFDLLSNDDVSYVLEQFMDDVEEAADNADDFRGDGDSDAARADGEDVGKPAKRTGGTGKRKSAGGASRSAAS